MIDVCCLSETCILKCYSGHEMSSELRQIALCFILSGTSFWSGSSSTSTGRRDTGAANVATGYNMMTHGLWRTWMFNMFCMGMFLGNRMDVKSHQFALKFSVFEGPCWENCTSPKSFVHPGNLYEWPRIPAWYLRDGGPIHGASAMKRQVLDIIFSFLWSEPHWSSLSTVRLRSPWILVWQCDICLNAFVAELRMPSQLEIPITCSLALWRKQVQFEGFFSNSSRLPFCNGWIWDSLFYEPSGILSKWRMPGFRDSNVCKKSSIVKDFLMFLYLLFSWILQFLHRCFAMKSSRKNSALLGASFPSWVSWFHTWDFLVCLHWSLSWSLG